MHNSSLEVENPTTARRLAATVTTGRRAQQQQLGGEVLTAVAALITEGRVPASSSSATGGKRIREGPHCAGLTKGQQQPRHQCNPASTGCKKFQTNCEKISNLYQKGIPLCIEVFFTCACKRLNNTDSDNLANAHLLEQWHFSITPKRNSNNTIFNFNQLVSAVRSQLYFSQIIAWLSTEDSASRISKDNIQYRLTSPRQALAPTKFFMTANKHEFPTANLDNGDTLSVSFYSAPRTLEVPMFDCKCSVESTVTKIDTSPPPVIDLNNGLLDDRMYTVCTLKGKHRCEDFEDLENIKANDKLGNKRICNTTNDDCEASTSKNYFKPKLKVTIETSTHSNIITEKRNISPNIEKHSKSQKLDYDDKLRQHRNDLSCARDNGQLLLDAIERSGKVLNEIPKDKAISSDCQCVQKDRCATNKSMSDNANCDMSESDIFSIKGKNSSFNVYVDKHCDSPMPLRRYRIRDISNIDIAKLKSRKVGAKQKITFDDTDGVKDDIVPEATSVEIPSSSEKAKFRKNLGNAAQMVFHAHTGLPLTSSPAPVRKGKSSFDFDSSLNSISAIKSALFSSGSFTDDESESDGSLVSPRSSEVCVRPGPDPPLVDWRRRRGRASNLLGSFEESVLNGRLEPVSTVHGFTAELGASGSFVPKHLFVPVTVFFYTLGDNDKVSSPYLGHINLGKKGYNVPKSGTVQVTLFNPLGTVVKMFVIMYNLSDMPPNSQTFIRQRTLYMPTNCKDTNLEWGPKWLRYLIHLRFMTSKSGKIYLHSDIRTIIFRKCDMDTATAHGIDISYELRSFTHMPTNPRFSPRK